MPNAFRSVERSEPLSQGDIFSAAPVVEVTFDPPFEVVWENGVYKEKSVEGGLKSGMTALARINLTPAIVLDQSCDALRSDSILLAPLLPCYLEGKKADKQWDYLKKLATSLHEPTRLYLPASSTYGLPRRIVDLGAKFTLPRDCTEQLVKQGGRVAGLSSEGLRYLQFRLSLVFSRAARDDEMWASGEDLALKVDALTHLIGKSKEQQRNKTAEAGNGKAQAADRQRLLDEAAEHEAEQRRLASELDVTIRYRDESLLSERPSGA